MPKKDGTPYWWEESSYKNAGEAFKGFDPLVQNYLTREDIDDNHRNEVFNLFSGQKQGSDQFLLKLQEQNEKELKRFKLAQSAPSLKDQMSKGVGTKAGTGGRFKGATILTGPMNTNSLATQGKTLLGM